MIIMISTGSVRLQGPLSNIGTGRVEVSLNGQWGTICDDGWDLNDARVVCRQLGYQDAVKALHGALVPDGSGKIWLDDVDCSGKEKRLTNCLHARVGKHNCFHFEDAGVECFRAEPLKKPVLSTVVRWRPTKTVSNVISSRTAYHRSSMIEKAAPTSVETKACSRNHSRPHYPTRLGEEEMPEETGENRKSRFNWKIVCVAAGAVFVFFVAVLIYRHKRRPTMKRDDENIRPSTSNEEINDDCERHYPEPYPTGHVQTTRPVRYDYNFSEDQPKRKSIRYGIKCDLHQKSEEQSSLMKRPSGTDTLRPDHGGILQVDDIILNLAPGCLAEDTEITLIKDDNNLAIKTLLDLGLVVGSPRVVELLPDGLKFVRPADLTISFENTLADSELFILHGSYNPDYRRVVWELVTNEIEEDMTKGVVTAKINGFCFYAFILAMRGVLARILSHLNHSFTSCAYAFYRRQPPMDKIDISVVVVSEFVDEYEENEIKQLKDHLKEGYVRSDKGMLKRVEIDHPLQVSLNFPGVEINTQCILVKVDQPELDSVGFVIDNFKGSAIAKPASGTVNICEVDHEDERRFLWKLNIHEIEQDKNEDEKDYVQSTKPERETQVVRRNTKLTTIEITRVSRMVAIDWDSLAGLLDIPYEKREEIRTNFTKYPDSPSKAEEVLEHFNGSDCFGRDILEKCADELGRHDLLKKLQPMKDEDDVTRNDVCQKDEIELLQTEIPECNGIQELETEILPEEDVKPLSPREMYRLSRCVGVDWDSLAGLMDITKEERDDIRYNVAIYSDHRSRAEKILSIFNRKKDFSRKKLVECLKGIRKLDVIRPVITGKWKVM
ncbi:uncharacterized protein LOC114527038 isoform X2 [Dendronephthya gigantea]|uniref:uncharacterized protein LOC114527038 isoform X2 n=1 Tax=Dendronephthya gigantea TaxID=151771 RepID=UPI00106AAE11|nr:uncharacterized protein LOC114527038 isoform X2 [Dendronephthya gigantea]